MTAKGKFLKEIQSAILANANDKWNSLVGGREKGLVAQIEDQSTHNIPISLSLLQSKALTVSNSMKAEMGAEAADVWS